MSRKTETDIRLYGFEELYQKLDAMPNKLNSVVDKALKECAKPVKEEAKRRARKSKSPTGTSGHGHMADHIEISDVEQKGTEKRVIVGFTKGDNSPFFMPNLLNGVHQVVHGLANIMAKNHLCDLHIKQKLWNR